ncbi:MAG TPA: heavy metal-binding domain-containing protein [Polyangiaceae bacterium]
MNPNYPGQPPQQFIAQNPQRQAGQGGPLPAADLPQHARERLGQMREHHFFTSDLSVNEFLLVKEVGFSPVGLVMGSSIYHIGYQAAKWGENMEMTMLTQALYHSRELAMARMEEEADALAADGIVGVRLTVNLHAWGSNIIEFLAIGTAVRNDKGQNWRAPNGKPFTSDLSGQDFWTLLRAGYRPLGFVMGNCVYHIAQQGLVGWLTSSNKNMELPNYTQGLYDARELAMERMQTEAQDLRAEGIVGVTVEETNHSWGNQMLEFSAVGTAVIAISQNHHIPSPTLVLSVND